MRDDGGGARVGDWPAERTPDGDERRRLPSSLAHLAGPLSAFGSPSPARLVAVAGVVATLTAFLWVLHDILVIVGDPTQLSYVVAGSLVVGTVLAGIIRPRTAALLGAGAVLGGTYLYISSLPGGFGFLVLVAPMAGDVWGLLSGLSVLRIVNADVWALSAAPGPVFLAWYLGLRGRYVSAGGVAGAALGVMVLTGDATTTQTLLGVVGVTVAAAFGDCDNRGERLRNADGVVVVLVGMVVLSLFVGVVPGAADSLVSTEGLGDDGETMESSLVHAGDSLAVTGPVELSPEVRYTVRADEEAYWRVDTYDRYTGGGWIQSGDRATYHEGAELEGPPGETRTIEQRFTVEAPIATLPAAAQPTRLEGAPVPVQVTEGDSFQPASPLEPGESYEVESQVPSASPATLREAGTDYPEEIESRYTQVPSSTPDRVAERTAQLTANADNPYDTARVLEHWFVNNYDYSLDVQRPDGDVADAFLFEMEAGYCTYFATAMVTMLRTQDVPARFAVGYTSGQQVDEDEWVVRGSNSHAWVEVYFPDHGWVEFDPTPPSEREQTAREELDEARGEGVDDAIDTADSLDSEYDRGTPEPRDGDADAAGGAGINGGGVNGIDGGAVNGDGIDGGEDALQEGPVAGDTDGDDGGLPAIPIPTREQLGFGLLVLAGLAAAGRRSGANARLARELWLRRLPGDDPETVVEGAYQRVVHLEERTRRPKRPGETPRQFLAGADHRARRVGAIYEQARYGRGVTDEDAAAAAAILAELLEERTRLPHLVNRNTATR